MSESALKKPPTPLKPEVDFYLEGGRYVFTAAYLLRRGTCCGSGCRHCPYGRAKKVVAKKVG